MSSSGYLPCIHWLWLYNTIQWEQREQAFLADDEWSGSSKCVTTCEEICSSLPTTMSSCDEQNSRESIMGSYMEIFPFGQHHTLETSWAWMKIFPIVMKCHRKCSVKMMDLLMTTMTLMMNALHLLRMKVNKIEGCLTHAMNAPMNMIWWLNIWQCSMWCSNSSFIGAACQMQPWVSLLTFPIILSMYLLINITLLSCTMN